VEEYLKGSGPSTVTIRTLGGQVGDQVMHVEGVPRFQPGRREALFLQSFAPEANTFGVHEWEQGRFRIVQNPETGQDMVERSLSGTRLVGERQPVRDATRQFSLRTLDDLRGAVRARRGEE
jgi:hypothetical protein